MAEKCKRRIAQVLMVIGVTPLVLGITWTATVINNAQSQLRLQGGASDAFLLIAILLFGYATAVVLGGIGALWSWHLTKLGLAKRSTATMFLQALVVITLLGPLLWYLTLISY